MLLHLLGRAVAERRPQLGQRLERRVGPRVLVSVDDGDLTLAARHLDLDDLFLELATLDRRHRLHLALVSELVLVRTGHARLHRRVLGVTAHVTVEKSAPEAVVDQAVHHVLAAELHAAPVPEQVVRRVRHRFRAAGHDDLGVARLDRLRRQHHRLQPRAADLVYGDRRHRGRDATADRSLARRRLTNAALQDLPEDHVLNLVGLDARPADDLFDHDRPELGRL